MNSKAKSGSNPFPYIITELYVTYFLMYEFRCEDILIIKWGLLLFVAFLTCAHTYMYSKLTEKHGGTLNSDHVYKWLC